MAVQMFSQLVRLFDELRYEPTGKRIRALADGHTVADTTAAVVVWEPRRVVPVYAVPAADLRGELLPAPAVDVPHRPARLREGLPEVLTPSTGFGAHTTAGEALTLRTTGGDRVGAAFRPADPDLAGFVLLDFDAFDWLEEDDAIVAHPRDPFHRVDIRHGSRHVRVERDGTVLAESGRPVLVFETSLPMRTYLPRDDVRIDLMEPSPTRTACAYKGVASYLARSGTDLAWTYESPLPDAHELAGLLCFFDERVDVTVDGEERPRPVTPWSD
ncbi:DUF427 domain-containing protein [Pseudonocardia adelaidensis]|uniref:DUF427 domain-containing protein n=1 Tax=Pseudonocardia adelaidensis TaxID=648754 RepID=A0ABP9NX01_9PSEU